MVDTPTPRKRGRPAKDEAISANFALVKTRHPVADGWHEFVITECKRERGPKAPYFAVTSALVEDDSATCYDNYSFSPEALWKVAGLLEALGFDTSGEVKIRPSDLQNGRYRGLVVNEEYNGRQVPRVTSCAATELEEDTEEETIVEEEPDEEEDSVEEYEEEDAPEEAEEAEEVEDETVEISEKDIRDMSTADLGSFLKELGITKKLIGPASVQRGTALKLLRNCDKVTVVA